MGLGSISIRIVALGVIMQKYILKSVEGQLVDGKLTVPKGSKYQTLGTLVELNINNGKRAGQKFLVSELPEGVEKGSADQFFANEYMGKAKGARAPIYVLTHKAAGAAANESTLICSLFVKKYEDGSSAIVGKNGTTRFYMETVEQAEARKAKYAKKA
jgi:hypothetical protein